MDRTDSSQSDGVGACRVQSQGGVGGHSTDWMARTQVEGEE